MTTEYGIATKHSPAPIGFDPDLIGTARAVYRGRHDYELGGARRWRNLQEDWPELAEAAQPKPNTGVGSGEDMTPGRCWLAEDQFRLFRRAASRKLSWSAMTMVDGSPLRVVAEGDHDVDGDPFIRIVESRIDARLLADYADEDDESPADNESDDEYTEEGSPIEFGDDEKLAAPFLFDGVHGEQLVRSRETRPAKPGLEHCALCGADLPLKRLPALCEFPESPMPDGLFCHCNGCLCPVERAPGGRRRYCPKKCAARMDNALDRAHRRRGGVKSRPSAADHTADRLAEYKLCVRDRARESRPSPRIDWYGIWQVPHWRAGPLSTHQLRQAESHVWEITLTNA